MSLWNENVNVGVRDEKSQEKNSKRKTKFNVRKYTIYILNFPTLPQSKKILEFENNFKF